MNRRFVLAVARREARTSARRFLLYGGCMALGISALVGLHGVRADVGAAIDAKSQQLLGADLMVSSRTPLDEEMRARVALLDEQMEAPPARVTRFASMVYAPRPERSRLVDVRGVEAGFPFHGEVRTEPAGLWTRLQEDDDVALVDPSLLVQLEAKLGDELVLGDRRFHIAGTVTRSPGTLGLRTEIAPRVFIAGDSVASTGLVQQGSMVDHILYLMLPGEAANAWVETHRAELDAAGVRARTVDAYEEELTRSFGALTRYLGLVGLAALALGGIGVASGVRVLVREKLDAVAVLRSLGARPRDVLAAYGLLAIAGGLAAGLAGAALGLVLQRLLPMLLADLLPVEAASHLSLGPVLTGIGLGLWITTIFAVGPLLDLAAVPPLRALRRDFSTDTGSRRGRIGVVLALAVTLVAASLWQAPGAATGLTFAAVLAAALALLAGSASAASAWLRRHRLRRAPYWLRQGVANLFRPRNHTVATTLAVGFGLFLVATVHGVESNVLRKIAADTSPDRPNLVLFDVQPDQLAPLEALLEERGARTLDRASLISVRIARLGEREAVSWFAEEELERDFRWALRREYRVTYAAELRDTETIVAGSWWQGEALRRGEPVPVSLESGIAETLGLEPGDAITWDVQGVPIESVVASVRRVDWGRMATNFFAVFPPGVLEEAPQSTVLLTRVADPGVRAALQRDLVVRFPNVSAFDATLMLRAFDALAGTIGRAVQMLALVTAVTGFAILLAAASTSRHERLREALLLRTLGASSRTVRRIARTEALALGTLAAGIGSTLAVLASWLLVRFVFELPFAPPVLDLLGLALVTLLLTAALAGSGVGSSLDRSPRAALREAELRGSS
jgi:putative ABC transport system permease protein